MHVLINTAQRLQMSSQQAAAWTVLEMEVNVYHQKDK